MSEWFDVCPECGSKLLVQLDDNLYQSANCNFTLEHETSNLIIDPDDPARSTLAAEVEQVQEQLFDIQRRFSAETLAFKAGSLAYEATRLFWYAVKSEADGGHYDDVAQRLSWVKQSLEGLDD